MRGVLQALLRPLSRGQRIEAMLALVLQRLETLTKMEAQEMADLSPIVTAVTNIEGQGASIIALVQHLAELYAQNSGDQQAILDISARINAEAEAFRVACETYTPQDPPPPQP